MKTKSVHCIIMPAKHVGVKRFVCMVFGHSRFLTKNNDRFDPFGDVTGPDSWHCVRCGKVVLMTGNRAVTFTMGGNLYYD